TPLYPQAGCVLPSAGGTCRNGDYRYGMAAALISGGASGYNSEAGFSSAMPWDEEGTINQASTGLAPGYLGAPLGPAVPTPAYSSGELGGNGDFESGVTGAGVRSWSTSALAIAGDTTTAVSGAGSLRMDVSRLSADPGICESRGTVALSTPTTPGEYTLDFWA